MTPLPSFSIPVTQTYVCQGLELRWFSLANSCTAEGGSPNDGWSGTQFAGGNGCTSFFPIVPGTFTYTVNCVQGPISAQASVTVTIENDAPYATLSVSSNSIAVGQTLTVTYKSNMSNCLLLLNPFGMEPSGLSLLNRTGGDSDGTQMYSGNGVGEVQFTYFCDGANGNSPVINATPQTVTVQQGITVSVSAPANAVAGTPFTLSWQTVGATSCSASGGGADGTSWSGNVSLPSGQKNITPTVTGNFTYVLTCIGPNPNDMLSAQATINVTAAASPPPPAGGSSSGGGGGGGGAFDGLALGILALAKILGGYRRRSITQGSQSSRETLNLKWHAIGCVARSATPRVHFPSRGT